jgi:hypothetical protein
MCIFSGARPLAFTAVGFSATHNIRRQSRKSDIDTGKTVGKNTLVLFISQITSMGLRFFYLISSGRYLGSVFFWTSDLCLCIYRDF